MNQIRIHRLSDTPTRFNIGDPKLRMVERCRFPRSGFWHTLREAGSRLV